MLCFLLIPLHSSTQNYPNMMKVILFIHFVLTYSYCIYVSPLLPSCFLLSIPPSTRRETTTWSKSMVSVVTTSSGWKKCLVRAPRTIRQSSSLRPKGGHQELQMDPQWPRRTREPQRGDISLTARRRRAPLLFNSTEDLHFFTWSSGVLFTFCCVTLDGRQMSGEARGPSFSGLVEDAFRNRCNLYCN